MKKIHIAVSKEYDVLIGTNLLCQIRDHIGNIGNPAKVAIISDSNVWPLYGQTLIDGLSDQFTCYHHIIPSGEASKNGQTYLEILNFLAKNQFTRSDLIIALGGGVVGDLTGFSAATYLRGIPYIQVPTSLLAMVDSSVGGKTAIDLPAGKNLVGAFYQPTLVVCDLSTLKTLPEDVFADGCAEVIKYGVLFDPELFEHLEKTGLSFDREYVISRCIECKRDVVCKDEFDTGLRQKLNLGHTIGHAVERNSNFTITHGQAVSIGMAMITRAANAQGQCSAEDRNRIVALLSAFTLPTQTTQTAEELYFSALSDKKRSADTVNLIIPQRIGDCAITPTPLFNFKSMIEAGLV